MDEAFWALSRGTGVMSLVLLSISVLLGVLTRSGRPAFGLPRFGVTLVHRNASLLGAVFVLIHVVSLFFDSYAQLNLIDLFVPFLGATNPLWLGAGTIAFDLLLAVIVTGLLRRRIGQRTFRAVHWFSYAMWPIAVAHGIGNGSDASEVWFLAIVAVCVIPVVAAVVWRVSTNFIEFRSTRAAEVAR